MKKIKLIAGCFLLSLTFNACLKADDIYESQYLPLSSFTIVNATTDVANARAYAAREDIAWKTLSATDAAAQYRFTHLGAYAVSNNIRAVNSADTTQILYKSAKLESFEAGQMNNLFLCGNATAGYEGVLISHTTPVNYPDSIIGIRFINLSPNSNPVNITLSTSTTMNESDNLAYKQYTDFKKYSATLSINSLIFQVRDASTQALLASYTLPASSASPYTTVGLAHARFKNLTLVIKGLAGTTSGTNAFGIFPVAHY